MKIVEILTAKHKREFLQLPVQLYKNEKNWIRPLDKDVEAVFDPKENKFFRHGECTRWLLLNQQGNTIGRVAAFWDKHTARKGNDQPTGGMGFFECIQDQEAAFLLFDTCKKWLTDRGMEAMDGPINFGNRDRWWGLLVEGFTEPNYCMPYNFLYYKDFFESYGFQVYFNQYTYYRKIVEPLAESVFKRAHRILNNPDYKVCHLETNKIEKYAEDFRTVYNKAWAKHAGVGLMKKEQSMALMKSMKPILDPEIIWFSYHKDEPIAFFIMIPEINQIIKRLNGRFNIFSKLKFLWLKKRGACKKIFGVIFGVVPDFQNKAVEAAMIVTYEHYAHVPNYRYEDLELNWIGDFNPKMMRVVEEICTTKSKIHITYRKLFDETKPFKRAPEL